LPQSEMEILLPALQRYERTLSENAIDSYFPDTGPLAWTEYKKHYEFWAHGAADNERCFLAANRVGKTIAGAFEVVMHLTGEYRSWWPGHKFADVIKAWACGDTSDTVRDIIQPVLLGPLSDIGTGLIPKRAIHDLRYKRGGGAAVDTVWVKHASNPVNRYSVLQFKSYEQGRKAFQGTGQELIWLDEEPSMDIYAECQLRTMGTKSGKAPGHLISTFTPLSGMSEVVLHFLPGGNIDG
jgi:phage terminase large subunit-like protein